MCYLQATLVDMLIYAVLRQIYPDGHHVRYTRLLRAIVIVNFSDGRQVSASNIYVITWESGVFYSDVPNASVDEVSCNSNCNIIRQAMNRNDVWN